MKNKIKELIKKKDPNNKVLDKKKENKKVDNKKAAKIAMKNNKKATKPKRNILLILIMVLGIGFIAVCIVFVALVVFTAPDFNVDLLYSKEATVLLNKDGVEFASIGSENRELVTYDELPQVLIDAIVSVEDSRFFQHGGFDMPRFAKATFGQLIGNSGAGGASTLTMQVSKNTFTSKDSEGITGVFRKFTDIYISIFKIEKAYTKEEIMEFYVNAPWLGNRTYGVEQACQLYFGKSVKDLNLAEASLIAGMFQAPAAYDPYAYPDNAAKRRETVLSLMVRHGYISEEEAEAANNVKIESMLIGYNALEQSPYQGFIDTVVQEVQDRTGDNPYNVPMIIQTTMDTSRQEVVNDMMQGKLYNFVNDTVQSAIAITDINDGSITAVGNGRNKNGEMLMNLATQMFRHPGSTAKPIMDYGPLIEYNGASPSWLFFDEPMTYSNGQSLRNADRTYLGMLTMKDALVKSRNIPAVQAFQKVDKLKIAEFAHSLGIDYGEELYESYAIGSFDGVSPLQLSAAYAAFGRGGYYIEPYSYTRIEYRQTGEIVEQSYEKVKVMSEETAFMVTSMLMQGGASGVGGTINVKGTDVAAKGGTSTYDSKVLKQYNIPDSASADNWIAVYTPDYSMAVWYGYEKLIKDGPYVTAVAGSNARRKISAAVANKVFKANSKFKVASGVVKVTVERDTIPPLLPSDHTPSDMLITDYYKKGTQPTEVSTRYATLANPTGGASTVVGPVINLSWNAIKTPNAIDSTWLSNYFDKGYGQFASKYLQERHNYNAGHIGAIGYQVYLKNSDGTLTSLGWTAGNTFTYTALSSSPHTFVIRSAYSIFKSNMSGGLEITTAGAASDIGNIILNSSTSCNFQTLPTQFTVYDNLGIDITSNPGLSFSTSTVPNGHAGTWPAAGNYTVTYTFTYNSGTPKTRTKPITCP